MTTQSTDGLAIPVGATSVDTGDESGRLFYGATSVTLRVDVTVAEALHHAQAAEKAMDTLRPYLDSRGQFVADIVHAATVGIGKLTVPDLYQAGAR